MSGWVWWCHPLNSGALGELTVRCPQIRVSLADYANCNGVYSLTNTSVLWSPSSPVYKHHSKDRSVPHQSPNSKQNKEELPYLGDILPILMGFWGENFVLKGGGSLLVVNWYRGKIIYTNVALAPSSPWLVLSQHWSHVWQINFLSLNLNNDQLGSSSGMPAAWAGQ